jgi:hypothetical protein
MQDTPYDQLLAHARTAAKAQQLQRDHAQQVAQEAAAGRQAPPPPPEASSGAPTQP